ncbi:MAG: MerR family transcriptional regulator [Coriobacteriaceae bacterium]|jgi:DNA-binding transcriptional MerR regulator|nr:MerR family transcriptional regulator [Olsenella sp.]RRF89513.1 MAG: MerR family transcriptional regulator [Coriobacteriaceae bacterium]
MYTIGQVSRMFDLPVSTIRYYDKMGLLPGLARTSGTRRFGEEQLEALRVIECLKRSGLEIRDIRHFMELCQEGPATYRERLDLFEEQRRKVDEKIAELERTRAMIDWKRWYYETAAKRGNEDFMVGAPDSLPEDGRRLWSAAHADRSQADAGEQDIREALEESRADFAAGRYYKNRASLMTAVTGKRARRTTA